LLFSLLSFFTEKALYLVLSEREMILIALLPLRKNSLVIYGLWLSIAFAFGGFYKFVPNCLHHFSYL